jgi:hypothetical protein
MGRGDMTHCKRFHRPFLRKARGEDRLCNSPGTWSKRQGKNVRNSPGALAQKQGPGRAAKPPLRLVMLSFTKRDAARCFRVDHLVGFQQILLEQQVAGHIVVFLF